MDWLMLGLVNDVRWCEVWYDWCKKSVIWIDGLFFTGNIRKPCSCWVVVDAYCIGNIFCTRVAVPVTCPFIQNWEQGWHWQCAYTDAAPWKRAMVQLFHQPKDFPGSSASLSTCLATFRLAESSWSSQKACQRSRYVMATDGGVANHRLLRKKSFFGLLRMYSTLLHSLQGRRSMNVSWPSSIFISFLKWQEPAPPPATGKTFG